MNDLILNNSENATMSSLEISELVESRHDTVKLSIERLAKSGVIQLPSVAETKNFQGVKVKHYLVGKRDSYVVVAQLSPEFTGRLVDRWQQLESRILSIPDFTNPAEAARAWALEYEGRIKALQKIEEDKPKVKFAEAVSDLDGCISIGDLAKLIGTGQNRLFKLLREEKFLMDNNRPYQSSLERGLFKVKEFPPWKDTNGKTYPSFKTVVTGRGQLYFEDRFRKEPYKMYIIQH